MYTAKFDAFVFDHITKQIDQNNSILNKRG